MYNNNNYGRNVFIAFVVNEIHHIIFSICHIIFTKSDKKEWSFIILMNSPLRLLYKYMIFVFQFQTDEIFICSVIYKFVMNYMVF